MASSVIAEAFVRVRPETSGFQQETQSGVLGAVKKIAVAAGGIFAAQKVFDFGKQAVDEASLTEKATENIKAQFGSAAKGVLAFGDSAAHSFGISRSASEGFSSQIGLVAKSLGLGHKEAATMDLNLQKLAGSVGLIKGEDPAGFFDKLKTALGGNTRGLKQMGIVVDTTREKQFLLNAGLVKATVDHTAVTKAVLAYQAAQKTTAQVLKDSGKNSVAYQTALNKEKSAQEALTKARQGSIPTLNAAQKAQAIVGLATQHLSQLQQEAKKHAGDFADQMIILRAELDNVKESIGAALLPVLDVLVKALIQLIPTLTAIADGFKSLVSAIPLDVIKGLALGIGVVTAAWAVYTAAQYAAATALAVFNAVLSVNPITLVVIAIVGLVAGLYILYQRVQVVHDAVQAAFGFLRTYVPAALAEVRSVILAFVAFGEAIWQHWGGVITSVVRTAWATIKTVIQADLKIIEGIINVVLGLIHGNWSQVWHGLQQIASGAVQGIIAMLRGSISVFVTIGSALINGLWNGAKSVWGSVVGWFRGLPHLLVTAVGNLGHLLYNAGAAMIQGLIDGIKSKIGAVGSVISGIASTVTSHFPNSPIAQRGPLRDFPPQKMGAGIVEALIEGIGSQSPKLNQQLDLLSATISRSFPGRTTPGGGLSAASAGGGGVVINGPVNFHTDAHSFDALAKDALNKKALRVRR